MSTLVRKFTSELDLYRHVIVHPRRPRVTQLCLAAAVLYALSPIDLIPDFIPVLGYVDDVLILPILIFIALRSIPKELVEGVRTQITAAEC